jgi:CheY-like chemotaxis protein
MWSRDVTCPLCGTPIRMDRSATWPLRYSGALLHLRQCESASSFSDEERAQAAHSIARLASAHDIAPPHDASSRFTRGSDGVALPSILIVEDDPEVGRFLTAALGAEYHCTVATDGAAAIDAMMRRRFHAVLLDLMLPRIDGLEVLRKTRAKDERFIVITAASVEMQNHALALGAERVIRKPFTIDDIRAALSTAAPS